MGNDVIFCGVIFSFVEGALLWNDVIFCGVILSCVEGALL